MHLRAFTFAAATYAATMLGHSSAQAYGRDVVHLPPDAHRHGWNIQSVPISNSLSEALFELRTVERTRAKAQRGDGPEVFVVLATAADIPVIPKLKNVNSDATGDIAGGKNDAPEQSETLDDEDISVALASPTEDADERIGKKKDRNRVWDPIEGVNRKVLGANDWLDRRVFRPIAKAYGFVAPDFLEQGIRNIFRNLREPATVGNRVLQGEFKMAGKSTARFLLNTTVGVAGFVDFADQVGLEREVADFGQTLYTYGVSAGPYLVVPLMGPTTTRDGFGQLVDRVADPATWVSFGAGTTIAVNSLDGVSLRQEVGDSVDQLRSTSIDWYSTLRSAYYQDRRAFLEGDAAGENENVEDLFDDFDDFDQEDAETQVN